MAGNSGQFLVGADEVALLADSRYTDPGRRRGARRADRAGLSTTWPSAGRDLSRRGCRRVAVEAGVRLRLTPGTGWPPPPRTCELVAGRGLGRGATGRSRSRRSSSASRRPVPSPTAALARLLPEHPAGHDRGRARPGSSSGGCGPTAPTAWRSMSPAWPAPRRPCRTARRAIGRSRPAQVLLFDFGAQVAGYRSDMTRTLFVGEPTARDLEIYELVRRAQQAAIDRRSGRHVAGGRSAADAGPWPTRSHATSSRPPAMATSSATAPATGSAWRPTSCPRWASAPLRRAAAQPDRLLRRAGRLPRGRDRASGSRTWSLFDLDARPARAADPLPARGHGHRGLRSPWAGGRAPRLQSGQPLRPIEPPAARIGASRRRTLQEPTSR